MSSKTLLVVLAVSGAVVTAIVLGFSSGSEPRGPERSETCGFGDCQEYYVGVSAQECSKLGGRWALPPWERDGRWFCFTGRPLSRAGRE